MPRKKPATTMRVKSIVLPESQWQGFEREARRLTKREGRHVSVAEVIRRRLAASESVEDAAQAAEA